MASLGRPPIHEDSHYQLVAEVYALADRNGLAKWKTVQRFFGWQTWRTAAKHVAEAKHRGFIT